MEQVLAHVTKHAMNFAIRNGVAITSTYALKQCSRLMKNVESSSEKDEMAKLQLRLDSKIKIISPAIDMIELISARGNTSLESAVSLTKSLRWEIQTLGSRLEKAVAEEQLSKRGSSRAKSRAQNDAEIKIIVSEMKKLLERIEDAVPLINLAITTSGVSLSTTLPPTVSPSRLLQASTFLTSGDLQYASAARAQQIGPTFTLSLYMLFEGHANRAREENLRETTWKEVMHKARVKLLRVPLDNIYDFPIPFENDHQRSGESKHRHIPSEGKAQEFAYQLLIVEDLDDGRVHTFEEDEPQPEAYDDVGLAGVREVIPIHELSKIFYADTGKILNIGTEGETNNPILLLKRDINAAPPRRMMDSGENGYESDDSHTIGEEDPEQTELEAQFHRGSTPHPEDTQFQEQKQSTFPWRLPATLDLSWMALEVYIEDYSSDSDLDDTDESELDLSSPSPGQQPGPRTGTESPSLLSSLSSLNIRPSTPRISPKAGSNTQLIPSPHKAATPSPHFESQAPTALPPIKTSLSLLEMLIRLTALQQFQQASHLTIPDEFLNFFLSDSSTVGAGGDADLRRRVRREARMRVGFDPYDESPIKRRGEQYLEHELHDGESGSEPTSPIASSHYDYDDFPSARSSKNLSRSRSNTPGRSPCLPSSTPNSGYRSKSSIEMSGAARPSLSSMSSPSPLLRRATTQPLKQPTFRPGPHSFRGSVAPDTPPSSVNRHL